MGAVFLQRPAQRFQRGPVEAAHGPFVGRACRHRFLDSPGGAYERERPADLFFEPWRERYVLEGRQKARLRSRGGRTGKRDGENECKAPGKNHSQRVR